MNNASFSGIVMHDSVIFVFNCFTGTVRRRCDCRLTRAACHDFYTQMIYSHQPQLLSVFFKFSFLFARQGKNAPCKGAIE
jgi:hypothetical protein